MIETIIRGRMRFVSWAIRGAGPTGIYRPTWPYFDVAKAIIAVVDTHPDRVIEAAYELQSRIWREDERDFQRFHERQTLKNEPSKMFGSSTELRMKEVPVLVLVNITSPGVSTGGYLAQNFGLV